MEVKKRSKDVPKLDILNEDEGNRFELELCWCIQKLQMSLANEKLQGKQASGFARTLNILKSDKAPLIKKRQAMRNTLGNYREEMLKEENKLGKTAHAMKFVPIAADKKSLFVKKASKHMGRGSNEESSCNQFKFNFESNDG